MYSSRNPVLGISEPLTEVPRKDDAPETMTATDCSQGGAEESEHSPSSVRRRRNLVVQVSVERYAEVEKLVKASGMPRAHFLSAAFMMGAKLLAQQLL
jgi:hypothetical protein